jgi:hypothetical protein
MQMIILSLSDYEHVRVNLGSPVDCGWSPVFCVDWWTGKDLVICYVYFHQCLSFLLAKMQLV